MPTLAPRTLAAALICALCATPAFAQLDKAEAALKDLEYGAALKALEVARKQVGNDRVTTLRILELQALTSATMGQDAKALKAFQALLTLVPTFKLSGNQPPRVTTVFYEARGWLDLNKPLAVELLPATVKDNAVTSVQAKVTNDPLKLVKELRFHLDVDGKASELDVTVGAATLSAPAAGVRVAWWVEALGEKKAVLAAFGSAAAPRVEAPVQPVAVAKPPPKDDGSRVEPREDSGAEISEWKEPPKPMPMGRVAGLAIAGGGVVVAGLGVAFGAMSAGTKAKVTGATTDASGRIVSLTQNEALALDAQQRTEASLANVFMISGAALAAGGVTLFLLTKDEVTVALAPAPGGVMVSGQF